MSSEASRRWRAVKLVNTGWCGKESNPTIAFVASLREGEVDAFRQLSRSFGGFLSDSRRFLGNPEALVLRRRRTIVHGACGFSVRPRHQSRLAAEVHDIAEACEGLIAGDARVPAFMVSKSKRSCPDGIGIVRSWRKERQAGHTTRAW